MLCSCESIDKVNPYDGSLNTLMVTVVYPDGYEGFLREGVTVSVEDVDRGNSYEMVTDSVGCATFLLTNGIYRVAVSDRSDDNIFNGTADRVQLVDKDLSLSLSLTYSKAGSLVFKEIYCGGCMRAPQEGTYQYDTYVILHNNDNQTQYLDSLCFGVLDPYNAQGTNVWITTDSETGASIYPDFLPIIQVIWQFGGDGTTFPLAPGEDAVICCFGAIDHAATYPLSVNLNKSDYFVCYNPLYFPNTTYHPAPGDQIQTGHYLNVVIKLGQANAFTFSINSPAPVIFRAKDTTIQEFVEDSDNVIDKPGSTVDRIVKIPLEWAVDGVEVFYGGSSSSKKRFNTSVDAGYVTLSDVYLGHTLYRYVDDQASAEAGYEILVDTNNSTNDLYEREEQSLHE